MEYDFIVAPGASPAPIQLHFAGAKKLRLTPEGDLAVIARNGEIAFHKPAVYQMQNGQRQPVEAGFKLEANNLIGFSLGNYDHSRELVIDPVLGYSTYLGGEGTDEVFAIAVDSTGEAYLTGETSSTVGTKSPQLFPTTSGSYQPLPDSGCCGTQTQAFVTKLNAAGTALVYSTFLGTGNNHGRAIAIDSSGDAYITGWTGGDFPVTPRVYQGSSGSGNGNAFITELAPTGASLVASTFLGGGQFSQGLGIAVDPNGDVFVAGQANDGCCGAQFPTTSGAYQTTNSAPSSVFVTRLSANFSTLAYSTFVGGSNGAGDAARGLAIDSSDNAYIVGYASSSNYPTTTSAFQKINNTTADTTTPAPGYNAIVSKIDPKGATLLYSTYLGGSGGYDTAHKLSYYDYGNAIQLDTSGNIYIAGTTGSTNFPITKGAFQVANPEVAKGGFQSGFIAKFNPALSALTYSTYLGGTDGASDTINGLAVDGVGDAYVTGTTTSTTFPLTPGAYQTSNPGAANLTTAPFLTKINSTGATLLFSTYFGGANGDTANTIAVDSDGNAYLGGFTDSTNFPTSSGAFQTANNSTSYTGWVAKLTPPGTTLLPTTTALSANPQTQTLGLPVTFTATVTEASGTPTGTVAFAIDGAVVDTLTLSGGSASYTTSSLAEGSHTVVATYSGTSTLDMSQASLSEVIVLPLAASPTFYPAGGTYNSVQAVYLVEATAGATVYYTIDGSTPTTASPVYSGRITVNSSTVVNAIAAASGYTNSNVASATYKIIGSPLALASPATSVATPNATLNGVVNTLGVTGSFYFVYGTSPTALTSATPVTALKAVSGVVPVGLSVSGLTTKTTYYYQIVVSTSGGTSSGAVSSFTTN